MLHLLAGREVVVPDRCRRRVPNPMPPTKRSERGIGDRDTLGDQLFVHAHQIAAALLVQLDDLIAMRRGFLRPVKPGHRRGAGFQHRPDRAPRDPEGPRNLSDPVALRL